MVERIKWQFKSNGINFIVFDPDNEFRTVAECPTEQDAKTICELQATAVYWADQQLREAEKRGVCEHEVERLKYERDVEIAKVGKWCAIHDKNIAIISALIDADNGMEFDEFVRKHGFGPGQAMLRAQNLIRLSGISG